MNPNTMVTKKTNDFIMAMVKANILSRMILDNDTAKGVIQEILDLPSQDAADKNGSTAGMLYHEYTDWVETYQG